MGIATWSIRYIRSHQSVSLQVMRGRDVAFSSRRRSSGPGQRKFHRKLEVMTSFLHGTGQQMMNRNEKRRKSMSAKIRAVIHGSYIDYKKTNQPINQSINRSGVFTVYSRWSTAVGGSKPCRVAGDTVGDLAPVSFARVIILPRIIVLRGDKMDCESVYPVLLIAEAGQAARCS